MRIAMIGAGFVGLVSGACFSEFGAEVIGVDQDVAKIEGLKVGLIPIFEPGLETLVKTSMKAGRRSFTTDLRQAVRASDIVFIAVGTTSLRGDGHADLSYVFAAAREIGEAIHGSLMEREVQRFCRSRLRRRWFLLIRPSPVPGRWGRSILHWRMGIGSG